MATRRTFFARSLGSSIEHPLPRSARWPWARAGLSAIIAAVLPLTWVVQIEGCSQAVGPTTSGPIVGRASTGLDLLRDLEPSALQLGLALAVALIVLAEPTWSAMASRASSRVAVHLVGLLATAGFWLEGLTLVFGATGTRLVQPAGYLVLTCLFACLGDAIARVVLALFEWRAEHDRGPSPRTATAGPPQEAGARS